MVRAITWLEDGTTVTLSLWGPGDLVSTASFHSDPCQLECLTKVEATLVPWQGWQHLTEMLMSQVQQTEELLLIRSHKRTDEMLIQLLTWLAKKFGRVVESGQLIDLRLTHQDIADLVGSTRVTITRTLIQFEEQGVIQRLPLQRIILREAPVWHYEI
jgi:CRP-like cAMP-binding protein